MRGWYVCFSCAARAKPLVHSITVTKPTWFIFGTELTSSVRDIMDQLDAANIHIATQGPNPMSDIEHLDVQLPQQPTTKLPDAIINKAVNIKYMNRRSRNLLA
jgi:hypothetical protein